MTIAILTMTVSGVRQPSQRRYVRYFHELLSGQAINVIKSGEHNHCPFSLQAHVLTHILACAEGKESESGDNSPFTSKIVHLKSAEMAPVPAMAKIGKNIYISSSTTFYFYYICDLSFRGLRGAPLCPFL